MVRHLATFVKVQYFCDDGSTEKLIILQIHPTSFIILGTLSLLARGERHLVPLSRRDDD